MGKKDKGKGKGKGKGKKGKKGKKSKKSASAPAAAPVFTPPPPPPKQYTIWEVLTNTLPEIKSSPEPLACLGAQSGTYEELCKLLATGLQSAERVLLLTTWGFFPVFREKDRELPIYFVADACTCMMHVYRLYDLKRGTAGFVRFDTTHDVVKFILDTRFRREKYDHLGKSRRLEDAIRDFCLQGKGHMAEVCLETGAVYSVEDYAELECLLKQAKRRRDGDEKRYSYFAEMKEEPPSLMAQ